MWMPTGVCAKYQQQPGAQVHQIHDAVFRWDSSCFVETNTQKTHSSFNKCIEKAAATRAIRQRAQCLRNRHKTSPTETAVEECKSSSLHCSLLGAWAEISSQERLVQEQQAKDGCMEEKQSVGLHWCSDPEADGLQRDPELYSGFTPQASLGTNPL